VPALHTARHPPPPQRSPNTARQAVRLLVRSQTPTPSNGRAEAVSLRSSTIGHWTCLGRQLASPPNIITELTGLSAFPWPVSIFPGQCITGR
jgi:hypothetical protein